MKGWVGLVGWPVADSLPTSGHPSTAGRAQDSESTPAKDRRSTTGPRNQLTETFCHNTFYRCPNLLTLVL